MKCLACARGFPEECENEVVCADTVYTDNSDAESLEVSEVNEDVSEEPDDVHGDDGRVLQRRVRRNKPDAALKDQQSTGRKRAALLYPLDREAPCEWRNKSGCGGGTKPIVGCSNGFQQARHHGPDYNTLNNDPTNVSRICHSCHNRWHAANDGDKDLSYLIQYGHKPKKLGTKEIHEHGPDED